MKEQTPKPCPFCGNRVLGVSSWKTDERVKQAVACHCGANGPYAKSYKDAVAAWNRRAGKLEVDIEARDVLTGRVVCQYAKPITDERETLRSEAVNFAFKILLRRRARTFRRARVPLTIIGQVGRGKGGAE